MDGPSLNVMLNDRTITPLKSKPAHAFIDTLEPGPLLIAIRWNHKGFKPIRPLSQKFRMPGFNPRPGIVSRNAKSRCRTKIRKPVNGRSNLSHDSNSTFLKTMNGFEISFIGSDSETNVTICWASRTCLIKYRLPFSETKAVAVFRRSSNESGSTLGPDSF